MVTIFLANGFEEIEALATADILRRAGIEVLLVGIGGREITGSHNIRVSADCADVEYTPDDMILFVLPGGMPGSEHLFESETVRHAIEYASKNNLYLAAICAAPMILGRLGLLKGKKATCFPGFEGELTGAQVIDTDVVIDGNIITAKGAGTAIPFALRLISLLRSEDVANEIGRTMQWK